MHGVNDTLFAYLFIHLCKQGDRHEKSTSVCTHIVCIGNNVKVWCLIEN